MSNARLLVPAVLPVLLLAAVAPASPPVARAVPPAAPTVTPPEPRTENVATTAALLRDEVYLVGRKDIAATLEPLRAGWGVLDLNEGGGGYSGIVAEARLGIDVEDYDTAFADRQADMVTDCLLAGGFDYMTPSELYCNFYPTLYERCYANFDASSLPDFIEDYCADCPDWEDTLWTGDPKGRVSGDPCDPFFADDSGEAFDNPNVNFYMFQGSVFSPVVLDDETAMEPVYTDVTDDIGYFTNYGYQDYPRFTDDFSQDLEVAFAQNVGFANNVGFPAGEWTYNYNHPLVTKYPVQHCDWLDPRDPVQSVLDADPCGQSDFSAGPLMSYNRLVFDMDTTDSLYGGPLTDDWYVPGSADTTMWWPILSPLAAETATLLELQIADRVTAFDSKTEKPVYNMVSGEWAVPYAVGTTLTPGYFWYNYFQAATGATVMGSPATEVEDIESFCDYYFHLPGTDYSDESKLHYQEWLEEKYDDDFQDLLDAWNVTDTSMSFTSTFGDFDDVDPLSQFSNHTPASGDLDWLQMYRDWTEFQTHQRDQLYDFQYRAAKGADLDGRMYLLMPIEDAMLRSDGSANAIYYDLGSPDRSGDLLTPRKVEGMQAAAYGESFNLPLFEMADDGRASVSFTGNPTMSGLGSTEEMLFEQYVPEWFVPTTHDTGDASFPRRTMREYFAMGLDSIGIEYWEVMGTYGSRYGTGATLVEDMADEAAAVQWRRSLTTPWRSPLLVHFDGTFEPVPAGQTEPNPTFEVLQVLTLEGAEFQAFENPGGMGDLWLTSDREVLVSSFIPGIDTDLVAAYGELVVDSSDLTTLLIYTDVDTLGDLESSSWIDEGSSPSVPGLPMSAEAYTIEDPMTSNPIGLVFGLTLGMNGELDSASRTFLEHSTGGVLAQVEAEVTRTVRPITVTADSSPTEDVALTVMTDGLNFLVSVSNVTGSLVEDVELDVDEPIAGGTVLGYDAYLLDDMNAWGSVTTFDLDQYESRMVYLAADVDYTGEDGDFEDYYDELDEKVDDLETAGYDVEAARQALRWAYSAVRADRWEKAFAAFARLERMAFAKYQTQSTNGQVTVVDLDEDPLETTYQVEFLHYGHHRTPVLTTNSSGVGTFPLDPSSLGSEYALPRAWDFVTEAYASMPDDLEINFRHPDYGTQSRIFVSN